MEIAAAEKANRQTARPSFAAGDVVLSCEPWVCAFRYRRYEFMCAYCFKESDLLLQCSSCKLHHYCGKECQTADWKIEHKRECNMLNEINANIRQLPTTAEQNYHGEFPFGTLEVLMAKIFNKIKSERKEKFAGIEGKLGALDVMKMLTYDPRYEKIFELSDRSLHKKIWPTASLGSFPADYKLARKVYYNAFPVFDQTGKEQLRGAGLFLSALHRQMTPVCWDINVTMDLRGRTVVVRATEDIVNYTGLKDLRQHEKVENLFPMTLHDRRLLVQGANLAPCTCSKCTEEYDAEINPLKCISSGCNERIPSDVRALQPCIQCGAMNDLRLGKFKDLSRKNVSPVPGIKDSNQRAKLQHALLLELDQADIVHPDAHFRYACGNHALRYLLKEQRYEEMWNLCRELIVCVRAIYPQYHLGRACFLLGAGEIPWMWYRQLGREGIRSKWKDILKAGVMDWLWEAREIYRKLSGPDNQFERRITQALRAVSHVTTDVGLGAVDHVRTDAGSKEFCSSTLQRK